eukprot:2031274-Rhodomonas_salina.2
MPIWIPKPDKDKMFFKTADCSFEMHKNQSNKTSGRSTAANSDERPVARGQLGTKRCVGFPKKKFSRYTGTRIRIKGLDRGRDAPGGNRAAETCGLTEQQL